MYPASISLCSTMMYLQRYTTIKKVWLEVMATLMPTANKALQQVIDLAKPF